MRLLAIFAAFTAAMASAGGLDAFLAFNASTRTATARFAQEVLDARGRVVERAEGTFAFARPGKFRWSYDKPHRQLLVGDGRRLWIHDPDLNQVTVKPMAGVIASTPAALLAGRDDITAHFTLTDAGASGGLDWVEARPRAADTGFERVRLGMRARTLAAMELADSLGGTTRLRFEDLEVNAKLPPGLFAFEPPPGADVIEDRPARPSGGA